MSSKFGRIKTLLRVKRVEAEFLFVLKSVIQLFQLDILFKATMVSAVGKAGKFSWRCFKLY